MHELVELADIIWKLWFPLFVALYLIFRLDRALTALVRQNEELLDLVREVRTVLIVRSKPVNSDR